MPRKLFSAILLLAVSGLVGCTAIYHRSFVAETEQPSSVEERRVIVDQYRQFMESNGYLAEVSTRGGGSWVSFKIRDARSRIIPTSRISDTVTIGTDSAGEIRLEILRITSYPPDDFSEKFIADFVAIIEKYIREKSGKGVKIRVVKRSET